MKRSIKRANATDITASEISFAIIKKERTLRYVKFQRDTMNYIEHKLAIELCKNKEEKTKDFELITLNLDEYKRCKQLLTSHLTDICCVYLLNVGFVCFFKFLMTFFDWVFLFWFCSEVTFYSFVLVLLPYFSCPQSFLSQTGTTQDFDCARQRLTKKRLVSDRNNSIQNQVILEELRESLIQANRQQDHMNFCVINLLGFSMKLTFQHAGILAILL